MGAVIEEWISSACIITRRIHSFNLDGYGHPSQHVERAAELGMSAMALTEHGNVSSHPKLEQAALKNGIKPIFGCELYTGPVEPTQRKNHLSVWAMNDEGYKDLLRLVSWAWSDGFYYEPTVTGDAFSELAGRLVVASGCTGSLLATSLVGGKNIDPSDASFSRGLRVASRFKELLGDRYYLEVQRFPELEATRAINPMLERISRRLKIPLVATADVHYCLPEDNEMQTILHAVRPGSKATFEEQARSWGYDVLLTHPLSDRQLMKQLVGTGLSRQAAACAISNSAVIAERCTVTLPKASPLNFPGEDDSIALWRRWLHEGWEYRGIADFPDVERYAERLRYEAEMIESKEFVDYFLIVAEMTRWAKDHGIFVGPARGSAAASLACWLLRITEVNPMLYSDLVFERFIDITRMDLPDIDLDFDDARRHEVFEHLRDLYGEDKYNQLGTFTTYKAKLSLDDVSRVFRIPKDATDKVKDLLITRSSGDLRSSATIEDTIEMFDEVRTVTEEHPDLLKSTRLEGMVKGMGRHAAGAIVSSVPLTDVCAVYGNAVAVDKHDAEYLNLLKIDVLGLNTMGMLSDVCEQIGWTLEDLYAIPTVDDATLTGFQDNDVVGIFQFDGRAMRLVNSNLHPDEFYEVSLVNALARPGPLHNNATTFYIDIKKGDMKPDFRHPLYDDIVKSTQYQVVFQEQILRILREIGQFDWTSLAQTRKIISKKEGEQAFNRKWAMFKKGAMSQGMDEDTAKKVWGMCITAGAYAFNAAHSVSYGLLGWWCMYMKQHHPLQFYVAALNRLSKDKNNELLRDAVRHGLRVNAPDLRRSEVSWRGVGKRTIQAGFSQIPGIGEKTAAVIIEWRNELVGDGYTWQDLIQVKGIGPKTIEMMMEFVTQDDPLGVNVLDKKLKAVVDDIEAGKLKTRDGSFLPMPTHTASTVPYGRGHDTQVVWIGTIVQRNLRDLFEVNFSRTGVALDPKEVSSPDKREWVLLQGADSDDMVTININRFLYPKMKEVVWNLKMGKDLVLVRGVKRGANPHKIIYCSDMWVFE